MNRPPSLLFSAVSGGLLLAPGLVACATAGDLGLTEEAAATSNALPPMVELRTRIFEMPQNNANSLAGFLVNEGSVTANLSEQPLTVILTDPQCRVVVRALEQRDGVEVLNDSGMAVLSGRQTQIQAVNFRYLAVAAKSQTNSLRLSGLTSTDVPAMPVPLGPAADVIPLVRPDGYSIQMTIIPSVLEFLGYEDPGKVVDQVTNSGSATATVVTNRPLPHFRLRQTTINATVWDGQTIVMVALGNVVRQRTIRTFGRAGEVRRLPKESIVTETNSLIYFVTPRLIDSAGNRIHKEDDLPFAKDSIPPQPPTKR